MHRKEYRISRNRESHRMNTTQKIIRAKVRRKDHSIVTLARVEVPIIKKEEYSILTPNKENKRFENDPNTKKED